jgi:hypothetical protein
MNYMISILEQHNQDKRFVMRAEVNDQVPTILAGWGVYPVGLE